MAFFNIRRNNNNKSPEELAKEIKETKAKIKAYKDEISKSKTDRNQTIKDIQEKMAKENADFENAIKKLDADKENILKQIKAFEKKKQTISISKRKETIFRSNQERC